MRIVRKIQDLNLDFSKSIGLVPTMGALHEGHLSLIRKAHEASEITVVSLFVNPTQFGPHEDFRNYPRAEASDAALARTAGADILFAPDVDEMYPSTTTTVTVSGAALLWEGNYRPGHFEGVATVVLKLFNIIRPKVAYFGIKDFQQCAVLKQMVADLNVPVVIQVEPTIREEDGLALSSRNVYLSTEQRVLAPSLFREIARIATGSKGSDRGIVTSLLESARARLEATGFRLDYLDVVDVVSLMPSAPTSGPCQVIAAAWLGATRLIDNAPIDS